MSSITEQLQALKVIPVIAIEQAEDIIPLGAALANNGLPVAGSPSAPTRLSKRSGCCARLIQRC